MWGAIATVGASLLGGLSSAQATREANRTNLKISREQMAWQEKMSGTAHQRQVEDMRKAGLNPVLSASQGGASTGSAQMIEAKPVNDLAGIENAINSAIETRRLKKEVEEAESRIELNNQGIQTQKTQQQLNNAETARKMLEAQALSDQLPAIKQKAILEQQRSKMDEKFLKFDSYSERLQRIIDGASSAVDIINPLKGVFKKPAPIPRQKGYTDENYNQKGEHTGSRTRRYHYELD